MAHPTLAYSGRSASRGIEVRRSRRSQKKRRGGSGAWTLRTDPPSVQPPNHGASTGDVLRRRFMGRTPVGRRPIGGFLRNQSDGGLRLLACGRLRWCPVSSVPGTCDLTPRRTDASDSAAPGAWKGPTFPHSEPPLLFSSCRFCHAVAAGQVRKSRMSPSWVCFAR